MMHSDDKKKMAMLIVGNKEEKEEEKESYSDEDMPSEALEMCMQQFMNAVDEGNVKKALKKFKKLSYLTAQHMKDDESNEDSDTEYPSDKY